jgi:hypothetical protein
VGQTGGDNAHDLGMRITPTLIVTLHIFYPRFPPVCYTPNGERGVKMYLSGFAKTPKEHGRFKKHFSLAKRCCFAKSFFQKRTVSLNLSESSELFLGLRRGMAGQAWPLTARCPCPYPTGRLVDRSARRVPWSAAVVGGFARAISSHPARGLAFHWAGLPARAGAVKRPVL